MKKFISWLTDNRGMAWATILIVIAQGFHYYHLFMGIELFKTYLANIFYATFLTVVLSLPLMIFTVKVGSIRKRKDKTIEYNERKDEYAQAIQWYTIVDMIINVYTWYTKLDVWHNFQWIDTPKYFVITMVAILIPITLKKFAGEVK